jgi:hypothetical protein
LLAIGGFGCGDDGEDDNTPGDGDGGGDGDGDGDGDGGGDADAGDFTLTGEVAPVPGTAPASSCEEGTDGRPNGQCYGFYCGTNSNSLQAGLAAGAVCGSTPEVFYACDGLTTRTVANCARDYATMPDARNLTEQCVRRTSELNVITDACLSCYLDSADCARTNCLFECATQDSPDCDACRETAGCTPGFYTCAGLPNPQ